MNRTADPVTILIEVDGHRLATAEIRRTAVTGVVHTDLHVESGHLPAGTRARLVDAVLAHPDVDHADRLLATMPLGDVEMLERVRQRCQQVQAHAAGATKLVEARVPRPR
jgi:hypothetical protein